MSEKITQLRLEESDTDFVPQAILRGSVGEIEKLARVKFLRFEDDLDCFDAAVLRIEPQKQVARHAADLKISFYSFAKEDVFERSKSDRSLMFMMQRYQNEPRDNITIFLPRRINSESGVRDAVRRILRVLGIPLSALIWQRADDPQL